ncbi:DUF1684 domain-containing protein [Marinilongibacter aquaticus]|uniref:DUF1684 domain-containing protein n=1 Tax=Marinilongibacter aquaticus TaxID=2975157 RepID=UPI0021BDD41D|nr:DUF1684 domain-containing protein [Marinilongibacter aquaticus]UBM57218.1 DUF1684 domain-containing protein [Marinilongibacter aquaticus]
MKNPKITKSPFAKRIICAIALLFCTQSLFAQNYAQELADFRKNYKADFLKDDHSPLKEEDLAYLDFYPPNESLKVKCEFEAIESSDTFELPTSSGKTKTYMVFGQLVFKIKAKSYRLNVYRSLALMKNPLYKDYLFIPFRDKTNGKSTYGAGRYLDLRMKELGDEIYLDFNKAYNPYCAYSLGYSCPIPPQENTLPLKIKAGEKKYKKELDH